MAEHQSTTGSEENKPQAPPAEVITSICIDSGSAQNSHPEEHDENLEEKPNFPNVKCFFCEKRQKEMDNDAIFNLFKIQALARVIIEKAGYVYNKQFCCSEAEAEDFGDEEEITFLNDLERLAEMIMEKVEQVHEGIT